MAMTVTLRDKIGNEILTTEIKVGEPRVYPEIIIRDDKSYALKAVNRDRRNAMYQEATVLELEATA